MPVSSSFGSLDIPEIDLFSFLRTQGERRFPQEKVIFQDAATGSTYTWERVFSAAVAFGKALVAAFTLGRGDVVILSSENSIDTAAIVLGILWTGATVSPANPNYTSNELQHQLQDSGATLVVTTKYGNVKTACEMVGIQDHHIVLLGDGEAGRQSHLQSWKDIITFPGTTSIHHPPQDIRPKSDVALLVYSSGTTGLPKGVRLSHFNLVASTMQIEIAEQSNLTWNGSNTAPGIPLPGGRQGDIVLACLPFFHIYGLTHMVLQPLYCGWKCLVMTRFEISAWCRAVQDYQVTYAYIVPPIALLLANHSAPVRYHLGSIRFANSGAAPLPSDLITKVRERTGIRIKQSYGLSEASPCAFAPQWSDWPRCAASAGHLLPNLQARFVPLPAEGDGEITVDTIKESPPGEPGELQLNGPNIFVGYHNKPDETMASFTKDGWFKTGDVGFLDPEGRLFITDRLKEFIKHKGFQIAPAELESILTQHPKVMDAAVVGVKEAEQATEVPRAYIVRRPGSSPANVVDNDDAQEIMDWLASRVIKYKRLSGGIDFVSSIPRNASGKILRRLLRERAAKDGGKGQPKI